MKKLILTVTTLLLLLTNCGRTNHITPDENCGFIDFKYYQGANTI